MSERTDCPHCLRPMGFEYTATEPGKCQLWRVLSEGGEGRDGINARTVADCFAHTSRRLKELTAALDDARTVAKAAQRSLARHHAAQHPAEFPDNARIE